MLLQEIDVASSRSFNIPIKGLVQGEFPQYQSAFAHNYLSPWVPAPACAP